MTRKLGSIVATGSDFQAIAAYRALIAQGDFLHKVTTAEYMKRFGSIARWGSQAAPEPSEPQGDSNVIDSVATPTEEPHANVRRF